MSVIFGDLGIILDTWSGWSVEAGGRFWPILATRGPYKDQIINLNIGTNITYSLTLRRPVKPNFCTFSCLKMCLFI